MKLKNKTKNRSCYSKKPTPSSINSSIKMNLFKTTPFVIIIVTALLVMIIAGGIGFVASGLMNVAIWLDRQAGDIRDDK